MPLQHPGFLLSGMIGAGETGIYETALIPCDKPGIQTSTRAPPQSGIPGLSQGMRVHWLGRGGRCACRPDDWEPTPTRESPSPLPQKPAYPLHGLAHFRGSAGIGQPQKVVAAMRVEIDAGRCRHTGLIEQPAGKRG